MRRNGVANVMQHDLEPNFGTGPWMVLCINCGTKDPETVEGCPGEVQE